MSSTRGWKHNENVPVLVSAARTASVNSSDLNNWNSKGLHLVIDVTAAVSTNEVQSVAVDAIGGTFKLTFSAQQTAALAFNITAANLKTALEGLSTIGAGNVAVTGGPGDSGATTPYVVTFQGALAGTNVAAMTADSTSLTGGGHTATVSTTTQGGTTPSIVFTVQGKDAVSGKYYDVLVSPAITATGTTVLKIYPGITASSNASANDVLPLTWRVKAVAANAQSATYSIGCNYVG